MDRNTGQLIEAHARAALDLIDTAAAAGLTHDSAVALVIMALGSLRRIVKLIDEAGAP